ncbi:hypothetical protein J5069_16775 [Candidatus Symbiopectobacterium sp. NZEC127]|uniref:hypothetical protein n=1 Tax=Candidatus Symbiopectobacterium sp. NZEC127 TaxID=2820472 RepID=UPI002227C947|nr:hypothetical protein [Candidatus Symbiopectobacterium sp. NZEC127]MCW2487556.1 hypothetical protein [Candidatus Symbiopectobacterium sp. NZEC127]
MKTNQLVISALALTSSLVTATSYGFPVNSETHAADNSQHSVLVAQKQTLKSSWKGFGITVNRAKDGIITVDGKPAALDEHNENAQVYSQGLNTVIFYKTGRVVLMRDGQFVGDLK